VVHLEGELLQPPRDLDRPSLVAEVALELTDDGRRGVGRELDRTLDVEAIGSPRLRKRLARYFTRFRYISAS
jgi:hypothetical protein